MSLRVPRRQFLQDTACGLAGASVWAKRMHGIEPIQRDGAAQFKFSLAAYSYRDLLTGDAPQLTLTEFIDDCARMQLDGTELTSYYFPPSPAPEYLQHLAEQASRLGLEISGTAVGNDFCHPPGEDRERQLDYVRSWVDYAAIMGAPVIRIFSGSVKEGQTEAEAHQLAVQGMEECCDYAGQRKVFLALENHGGLTTHPEGMLALVRDVSSPWFGVNLDTGNFHGTDPYAELAQLAPYALNVQVKVVVRPAGEEAQPADFPRLAAMLRDVGYRGYIVLEYEEAEDPRAACPRYLDELRAAFI